MRQLEGAHQTALFRWAELVSGVYPELARMFHIPNGGKRDPLAKLHPDLCPWYELPCKERYKD